MTVYHHLLGEHRERLNALNVYPVPDADTGANLASTLGAVVDALSSGDEEGMGAVCAAVARGALLGARGASGVIMSQILGALTGHLTELDEASGSDLARGLDAARSAAYGAVLRPVEGTILTVLAAAADASGDAASNGASVTTVLDAARSAGAAALEATTEMLPALRAAGVVDAGGAGFLLLLDAFLNVVDGREPPAAPPRPRASARRGPSADTPRYEVVVRMSAAEGVMAEFRAVWDRLGNDSTVIVGAGGTRVCHIHTDHPEAAMEAARAAGEIHDVQVTDLVEQITALSAGTSPGTAAVVAVAQGGGIQQYLRSLGATAIVAGGPSMNPSTAELLRGVEATGAPVVVLLPNDENVVPAARQVADLASSRVLVVPTESVVAGAAALRGFAPEAPDGGASAMRSIAAGVASGGVTRAVRTADTPDGRIERGAWMARSGRGGISTAGSSGDAVRGLLADLASGGVPARVTLVRGEGSDPETDSAIREFVASRWPEAELVEIDGGQPHDAYLVGVEGRTGAE